MRPSDGRFLGSAAIQAGIARAEQRLATKMDETTAATDELERAQGEAQERANALQMERQRRDLLQEAAKLPIVRQRAVTSAARLRETDDSRRQTDHARNTAASELAEAQARLKEATREKDRYEKQLEGEQKALIEGDTRLAQIASELDVLRSSLTPELRRRAEAAELDGPETVENDLKRAMHDFDLMGQPPAPEIRLEAAQLESNVTELEQHVKERTREADAAGAELEACRARYIEVVGHTLREYRARASELGRGAEIVVEMDLPDLKGDDAVLDEACISPLFGFDGKEPLPMGDSSFSGGQQVVAGLILLMAMAETEGRGFFLLDEPFAHLSIDRVDQVGRFLSASGAQFIITAPTTLDRGQLNPASMVIVLQKKRKDAPFAPPPLVAVS